MCEHWLQARHHYKQAQKLINGKLDGRLKNVVEKDAQATLKPEIMLEVSWAKDKKDWTDAQWAKFCITF